MKTFFLATFLGVIVLNLSPQDSSRGVVVLTEEGLRIHHSALLIDGHNDLAWQIRDKGKSSFDVLDIAGPQPTLYTDIPRLRRGGVGAQFWVVFAETSTTETHTAAHEALEQFDLVYRMIERYPETFELALTADDIERIHAQGKIASLIGVEGGHLIENSLAILRIYHRLGARYLTLTHAASTDWAESCVDEGKEATGPRGLTAFGEQVVHEMNRLGMLVDISHVSARTMQDVLRVSLAPVIASHSSARAVHDHPRNVPDDILRLVAGNGGVVMVNFVSAFLVGERAADHPHPRGTVHDVVDHIDHIVEIAGIDHVGIGSDFDGTSHVPEQLDDVAHYPYLTQALLDRGYDEEGVRKILGLNLLRCLRRVEKVAGELRNKHD